MFKNKLRGIVLSAVTILSLSACASGQNGEINDPIESVNRGIFKFNDAVDTAVIRPVALGYRHNVPQPARNGVRNFLRNLKSPTNIANDLLQGDLKGAGDTTTRLFANTLFGVAGIFDVAGAEGVAYQDEDFGQTLGKWGVGNSPYLVLPLLGSSSVRDATGLLVDTYTDPLNLYLSNTDQMGWWYARVGVASLDKREELLDVLDDLKKNSIDYYAAVRSAYAQKRDAQIKDQSAGSTDAGALPDIP